MELKQIECGDKAYEPRSVDSSEVEDVGYAHIVIAVPGERQVPRGLKTERSFFLWRPTKDGPWQPIPVSDLQRVSALCFDKSVEPCGSDEDQNKHIGDMVLMIDGDVVLTD